MNEISFEIYYNFSVNFPFACTIPFEIHWNFSTNFVFVLLKICSSIQYFQIFGRGKKKIKILNRQDNYYNRN